MIRPRSELELTHFTALGKSALHVTTNSLASYVQLGKLHKSSYAQNFIIWTTMRMSVSVAKWGNTLSEPQYLLDLTG